MVFFLLSTAIHLLFSVFDLSAAGTITSFVLCKASASHVPDVGLLSFFKITFIHFSVSMECGEKRKIITLVVRKICGCEGIPRN